MPKLDYFLWEKKITTKLYQCVLLLIWVFLEGLEFCCIFFHSFICRDIHSLLKIGRTTFSLAFNLPFPIFFLLPSLLPIIAKSKKYWGEGIKECWGVMVCPLPSLPLYQSVSLSHNFFNIWKVWIFFKLMWFNTLFVAPFLGIIESFDTVTNTKKYNIYNIHIQKQTTQYLAPMDS